MPLGNLLAVVVLKVCASSLHLPGPPADWPVDPTALGTQRAPKDLLIWDTGGLNRAECLDTWGG